MVRPVISCAVQMRSGTAKTKLTRCISNKGIKKNMWYDYTGLEKKIETSKKDANWTRLALWITGTEKCDEHSARVEKNSTFKIYRYKDIENDRGKTVI